MIHEADEEEDIIDYMIDKKAYYEKQEAKTPTIDRILSKLAISSSTKNVKITFLIALAEELSASKLEQEEEILQRYLKKLL